MTVTFERDSLGQIVSKSADGQRTTYDYDAAGNLIHAIGPDAELLVQRDKLGRVKTELLNGRSPTYTYDAIGNRTRRVTPSGAASSFTYDDAGNRATLMASGHTLEFTRDVVLSPHPPARRRRCRPRVHLGPRRPLDCANRQKPFGDPRAAADLHVQA